jgi:hypothetical protein
MNWSRNSITPQYLWESSKQFRSSDKKWHLSLRRYSNFQPLLTSRLSALSYILTTREIKRNVDIKVVLCLINNHPKDTTRNAHVPPIFKLCVRCRRVVNSRPGRFTTWKDLFRYHSVRAWIWPIACLQVVLKRKHFCHRQESNTQTVTQSP